MKPQANSLISEFTSSSSKRTDATLLIDMAISLLLLAILEQHSGAEHEQNIDPDNSECAGEDDIEEVVGEAGERRHASDLSSGCEGIRAGTVGDERWRGAV